MSTMKELGVSTRLALFPACNFRCTYCSPRTGEFPGAMEDYRATPGSDYLPTSVLIPGILALGDSGLNAFRFTGGEPTLRDDWDEVSKQLHAAKREHDVTTNMSTMGRYLDRHKNKLPPVGMVKVSFDTADHAAFFEATGGRGDIADIEKQIKRLTTLGYKVRANAVLAREGCNEKDIGGIINRARELGISGIQFLDLVFYPNLAATDAKIAEMRDFWEREYVSFSTFRKVIQQLFPGQQFTQTNIMFGVNFWTTVLPNGMTVGFKDSTVTPRDEACLSCPVTCQEGRCLVRIGTDGNVTPCPDYRLQRYHFSLPDAMENGDLGKKMDPIVKSFTTSRRISSLGMFIKHHGLKTPKGYEEI